jgi:hypothetical protein
MEDSVNPTLCDWLISLQFLFVHEQENSFSGAIPSVQFCSQLSTAAAVISAWPIAAAVHAFRHRVRRCRPVVLRVEGIEYGP